MALGRAAVADLVEGTIGLARGEAADVGLWPNPELSYAREETRGGPSTSREDYLLLSQALDLSGRRRLLRRSAERGIGRAVHEAGSLRRDIAAETRLRFFEALAAQQRVEVAGRAAAALERIAETVARREAGGDASGYERRRIGREHASARGRLLVEVAALERARERLRALIGSGHDPSEALVASGELPPEEPVPSLETLLAGLARTSEIRALDEEIAAAELERRAFERWRWPDLTVGGGYKHVALPAESVSGFLISASVPLPLFDRGQGKSLGSESRRRLAAGRREVELERLGGEVRGLWQEATRLAEAAGTQRGQSQDARTLQRIAEAAYEGGEVGVLELVDAYRGAFDAELLALDLEAAARRARVELDRLTGGNPP